MPELPVEIRELVAADWGAVRSIYIAGIAAGDATFETTAPSWQDWDSSHLSDCRLVAHSSGRVAGWAALSPVSDRCVYGGVAEVSVYVDPEAQGRGVGGRLLEALVKASEQAGLWTLQAGIFPENEASLRLHVGAGFRRVGVRHRLGKMGEQWRDVVLMERRSKVIGVE